MSTSNSIPYSSRCMENVQEYTQAPGPRALDEDFSRFGIQPRNNSAPSSETTPKQPYSIQTNPPLGSLHIDASLASHISGISDEATAVVGEIAMPADIEKSNRNSHDNSENKSIIFLQEEDDKKDEDGMGATDKSLPPNFHYVNVGGNNISSSASNRPVVHTEFRDKDGGHYVTTVYQGGSRMPTTVMQVGSGNNITVYQNGQSFPSHSGRSHGGASSGASNNVRTKPTPVAPRQIVVPNRVVEPADLDRVSKLIPKQWKSVGRQLKVSDSTMEALEVDHGREGVNEVAYQMLRHWSHSNGEAATMQVLAKALVDAKCVEVVEKVLSTKNKN